MVHGSCRHNVCLLVCLMSESAKALNMSLWAAAILAAGIFIIAGGAKLAGAMIEHFEAWGYAPEFGLAIGFAEIAGALGLVIPRTSGWAALGLIVIMFGALGTHFVEADYAAAMVPMVMLALLSFVLFGRGLGPRGRSFADLRLPAIPGF